MNILIAFLLGAAITAFLSLGYALWQRAEQERMMRSIIQGLPIPTFVIDHKHRVLYWNKALELLSGVKTKQIIGTSNHWQAFYRAPRPCLADLIVDEKLSEGEKWYSDRITPSIPLKEAYEATEFFPGFGAHGRWVHITAAAIRDSRGRMAGAIETLEDITDRKRAEDELIRMKKLESLGTFARGVAQDFDALLTAILRNIFLAKLSADEEDKILEEGLAIAEKAGLQAKELAHKLITFAKGGYPVRHPEKLEPILMRALKAKTKDGVEYRISIPPDLWTVNVDAKQIYQVFENILQNALDAMPDGGRVEVKAENTTEEEETGILKPGRYVRVSFRDSGTGIKEEDLPRIFDPYFTTKGSRGRGVGLGLAVTYSILKNHEGHIAVTSTPGEGTVFQLYLPAIED
ncbi:MAG TPA: ATP-binding protein [Syntrophales bacterium]|nr:ATP-binding protein [Syntrophales bacterium]HOL59376.1 ATP-binding protein [Syntrophales bacterium]HPO35533.1 ATP-binding protein [Syntrophales bacterium]